MANQCAITKPTGMDYHVWTENSTQYAGTPGYLGAQTSQGQTYYFDADQYSIVCSAFPNAGGSSDPLISQAGAINALNASVANLQTEVTALVSGSTVSPPNPDMLQASSIMFGAALLAGGLIWGAKQLYNQFKASHDD